jgi:hypothetical protein
MEQLEKIKERLGPCGIHCGKCFAYTDGTIRKSSLELKKALGYFDVYAQRFADLLDEPVFKKYPDFKELLTYFTTVECSGCRKEKCKLLKDCKVRDCHEEKGVDFCFQCPEFPCGNTGFDDHLYKRSVDINRRMQEIGMEEYYEEIKDKPRY